MCVVECVWRGVCVCACGVWCICVWCVCGSVCVWRGVCVVCEVYVCRVCIYVYVLVACVLYVWRGVCLCVLHECVAHAAGMYAYVYVVMCVVYVCGGACVCLVCTYV